MKRNQRCFGRNSNRSRCGRHGEWRFFCSEHKNQWLGWLAFLIFTVLAGTASIVGWLAPHFPSDEKTSALYIKGARFEPVHNFFISNYQGVPNDLYETSFLYLTVLNVSDADIYITSLEVIDVNKRGILSSSYSSAGLSDDISKNTVVNIPAGKEVEIGYSGGFKFSGLVKELDLKSFSKEYYFSDTYPKFSSRTNLVQEFNNRLENVLGGEAKIKVKLYAGNRVLIHEHVFDITNGTDIFEKSGKLQHSFMLGDLIHHLNSPYSKEVLDGALKLSSDNSPPNT
ncbi:hypothetical protein KIN38_22450 [Vibrio sp. B511a]|uniref:hypothetical protein n=1 Tax=Vibrio sp. B511a TaxID=2835905 RepID=UPI001DBCC704|nr:hypothetical protein [Vibrio sp. B511a]EGQ8020001.1 hypothetical protein [Vibrio alginolyticus]MDK9735476.1 hypothetical protein [Vibrio sp. B511a]